MALRHRNAILFLAMLLSLCFVSACSQSDPRWDKIHNLNYVPGSSDKNQTLDLYLPKTAEGNHPQLVPLIIWVHGGSWRGGDKNGPPWLDRFISNGYAVASLSYRLVTNDVNNPGRFPAQINDVKAAVRYLRSQSKHYHLDPDHFGAFGSSAGGHLVALLGASNGNSELEGSLGNGKESSEVQAVCDACGPANFFSLNQQF
ncbi:MAG: alpha/beta hydrolase, partial [Candidatus Obscuribacterales bacterium]|nr:alpha/beta hydrolase [Candidatus Obscuribacterales bacterium]